MADRRVGEAFLELTAKMLSDPVALVPRAMVEYRSLEGDTGETNGGHWCGESYEGGFVTYCLVLYGAFAQFSHWFPAKERLDRFFEYVESGWGTGAGLPIWAPSRKHDEAFKRWFARRERLGARVEP
jgi:hypothetical protein